MPVSISTFCHNILWMCAMYGFGPEEMHEAAMTIMAGEIVQGR
jgi:hypothetical protein